ncbi:ABC transporter permease [Desulfuromonas acetoxidans]|uniref:Binding-protein-dependent transport systems inner membrane component n=1 Tax=Desulfuromonas acetoxidans (strain DSM 684 / 11070) TaxID=281689 RepID=Q1JXX8_DESA6|nr:ABC transporter permease [Desulfuromonas acetoxidans]EAT15015.1 binding-protein-dependent transport systems inner membrane component [Desulfuromonas acetoxidans DSM 684]MBF0646820.1 ABC transporter permease [Desulfuromonas acetoxidans]NVD24942.1 ABC transporter permease [Desulfuromonas acetoxidans]NVE15243.1 ABC transporter permease [Desulfuromonas acetoxidans]
MMSPTWKQRLWRMIGPTLLIVALWQITAWGVTNLRGVPFPTPLVTLQRLMELFANQPLAGYSLYHHMAVSLTRWLDAFALATLCGISYGLLSSRWNGLHTLTAPIPQLLLLIPGLAWIPVAILIFGIGEGATRFMIAMTAFAPIALATINGIKGVNIHYIRAAQMLGATPTTLFFQVLLPSALPALISGLRIGLGNSWRVLVAAEMVVGTGSGLGFSIIEARWSLDYPSALACVVIICLIGLILEYGLIRPLEKRTLERWMVQRRSNDV